MTSFLIYAPLGLCCMISVWFGWHGRIRSFALLVLASMLIAALVLSGVSDQALRSQIGVMLLAAVAMFLASGYGMGFLAHRAKMNRDSND